MAYESGGVKATVMDDAMQRAPVFHFDDAGEAKSLRGLDDGNILTKSKNRPRPPPGSGQLRNIEKYPVAAS